MCELGIQPLDNLSVAIVCRDNIATIWRTAESVRGLAGEIVAVDSGSADGTVELLERVGARVERSEWLGHVRTKQKALDLCTREWVLCLDSDEAPDPVLAAAVRGAVGGGVRADGFAVNRKTYYRGRALEHAWQPEWRVRLVRRGAAAWTGLDPHDELRVREGGRVERLGGHLRHDSFPTFSEHMRKQWSHATTMARSMHAAGERSSYARLIVSPAGAFVKQVFVKRGFLDGYAGWLAGASAAMAAMVKHATLIELEKSEGGERGR